MNGRQEQIKLESFKHLFLTLTNDDEYSHTDQQKLYQFCQRSGLNWQEARMYVRDAASALLVRVLTNKPLTLPLSAVDRAELEHWRRRLALSFDDLHSILEQVAPAAVTSPASQPRQPAQRLSTGMLRSHIASVPTTRLTD